MSERNLTDAALGGALFALLPITIGAIGVGLFLGPVYLAIVLFPNQPFLAVTLPPLALGAVLACAWIAVIAEWAESLE